jgi:hypothetical protein
VRALLQQISIPLLAVATVLIVTWVSARVISSTRERRFRIRETQAPETDRRSIAAYWGVPEVQPSDTALSDQLDQLNRPLHSLHTEANALQSTYHARVARCVSCLALALIALGLDLTVFHYHKDLERFAAALEPAALIVALQQWWAARAANHLWVTARAKVELLRQWAFLRLMFQPAGTWVVASDSESDFNAQVAEIEAHVTLGQVKGWCDSVFHFIRRGNRMAEPIEDRVRAYWTTTKSRYMATKPTKLSERDVYFYLMRRPIRQLSWFRVAQRRLQRGRKLREAALSFLFVLSVALAVCKAVLILRSSAESDIAYALVDNDQTAIDLVAFGLLIAVALSAGLTTIYLSRNDRSLLHRYAAQQRHVEKWLRDTLGDPSHAGKGIQALPTEKLTKQVLEFEELMIDELTDWINISSHDSLELAL